MSRTPHHDVLIAGAGPAGAHTALRLARRGWRVALLDARTFPREKPCGEFLSPACLPLLEELELLEPLLRSGAARVNGMDLVAHGSRTHGDFAALGRFSPTHGGGLGVRREVLDHQAVRAAQAEPNVEVLLGWRVRGPLQRADGRTVGCAVRDPEGTAVELHSRFVVGADGSNGRLARMLGWRDPAREPARFAIVARFEEVPARPHAEVHLLGRDYFAACPIDAGLFTANLVLDGRELVGRGAALEALFRERLRDAPALAERLSGARLHAAVSACGPLRSQVRRCSAPGIALVGDACGFVDPLTGEGLYFAMQGARLLAAELDAALHDPRREPAALRRYGRARRLEFAPRYGLARLLQRGLRRPGVPDRVVAALDRAPAVYDLLLGLTGDYVPPRGLLTPGVWLSLLARGRAVAG